MADYPTRITHMNGNVVFTEDGGVFLNYLMLGPIFNPYDTNSIDGCQRTQDSMFAAMTRVTEADIFVGGFKTRTSTDAIITRITDSIPNFSSANYPNLQLHLQALRSDLDAGIDPEINRIHWVSIRMGTPVSMFTRLTASLFEANPHKDIRSKDIQRFREDIEACIPDTVSAWRTNPTDMDWIYNRSHLRGQFEMIPIKDLPAEPKKNRPLIEGITMGERSFAPSVVDMNTDTVAITDKFIEQVLSDVTDEDRKEREKQMRRSFRQNFKTLGSGQETGSVISVALPEMRDATFPDGPISYQQVLAFTRYPRGTTDDLGSFTDVADALNGLDGDWVLRIEPNQDDVDIDQIEERLEELASFDAANSKTEIRSSTYQARKEEVADYAANVLHEESGARGIRVTGLIAFGHANRETLVNNVAATCAEIRDRGFLLRTVPGGCLSLWKSMFPCTPMTPLLRSLAHPTTTARLSGFVPIRRLAAGDGMGPPVFRIAENALSPYVHLDILTGTLRGNGSIMFSGAQGSSKSYTAKFILSWMNDMKIPAFILDPQGEWATTVTAYDSYQIVNFVNSDVTLDPFQVFASDPEQAARAFVEWFSILLGVRQGTHESAALTEIAQATYRHDFDLPTSRDVLRHILEVKKFEWRNLEPLAAEALANPLLSAFIDPPREPGAPRRQVFEPRARNIVFVVRGLRLPDADKARADYDMEERYTFMANTAVARITKYYFDQMTGPARFIADELAAYNDQSILMDLIQAPDREGRKFGKSVMALSQLGDDLRRRQYKLIPKKVVYRQETVTNAVDALEWADILPTKNLVRRLITDTSPLDDDPNRKRKPIRGREGEGWFSMNGNIYRIKSLSESMPERASKADTTVTNFERFTGDGPSTSLEGVA